MSAPREEEVIMQEMEEEQKKPSQMCVISKSGVTLFGFHLSWMVVVLIVVLVGFWLYQSGMLPESVSDILSGSQPSSPVRTTGTTSSTRTTGQVMSGGASLRSPFENPGQVRQMMGH